MKTMNKVFICLVFLLLASPVHAVPASLSFEPATIQIKEGQTARFNINIYTDNDPVASTDVMITYDPTYLEPVLNGTVNGSIFQKVGTKLITQGKLYIYGIQENPDDATPAQGTISTISFKALKSGSSQLMFDCNPTNEITSQIIKNNADLDNIINCTSTISHTAQITISSGNVLGTYTETYAKLNAYTAIFGILIAVFTFFVFLKYQKLRKDIS